jgi:hypothetical protein
VASQTQGVENTDNIVIAVYNYAGVVPKTLKLAEAQTSMIFAEAGVTIDWKELPLSAEGRPLVIDQPVIRPVAYVKLVPGSRTPAEHYPAGTLGCALNNQVYVFPDLISAMTTKAQFPLQIGLAHIMAHELGHALLGPDNHTANGIMAPGFGQEQFRLMQMGHLLFGPEQKNQLHERIRAQRNNQKAVLQPSN